MPLQAWGLQAEYRQCSAAPGSLGCFGAHSRIGTTLDIYTHVVIRDQVARRYCQLELAGKRQDDRLGAKIFDLRHPGLELNELLLAGAST